MAHDPTAPISNVGGVRQTTGASDELTTPGDAGTIEGFQDSKTGDLNYKFTGPGDLTNAVSQSINAAPRFGITDAQAFVDNPIAARIATTFVLQQNPKLNGNTQLGEGDFASWSMKDICRFLMKPENMSLLSGGTGTAIDANPAASALLGNKKPGGMGLPPF